MIPKLETTTSKPASSNGSSSASPSTHSTSTPASAARRRAASNNSGVMSSPVTAAPATAAGIAQLPVPQATSSGGVPGFDLDPPDEIVADGPDPLGDRVEVPGGPGRPRPLPLLAVAHLGDPTRWSALRQLLLELEHRREQVAVLGDPLEHLRGLEAHRLGVAAVGELPRPRPSAAASTPRAARGSAASRPRPWSSSSRSGSSRPAPCPCAAPSSAVETTSSGSARSSAWATARA